MPSKLTSRFSLLSELGGMLPRWAVDELDDLPGDLSEQAMIDGGSGLCDDGTAAWVVKSAGRPSVQAVRLRARPSTAAVFGLQTIVMRQQNGRAVDLTIGGMNAQHQIAATARSRSSGSVWAVLVNGEQWLQPQVGGTMNAAMDIDDSGYIVGAHGLGIGQSSACFWTNASAAGPQVFGPPAHTAAACAVSPTTRAVAGNAISDIGPGAAAHPWYVDQQGAVHLGYVNGLSNGGVVHDINDSWVSCGANREPSGELRAWRWSPGTGVTWLRGLATQGVEQPGEAYSLNRYGDAVGRSNGRAVMWGAGFTNSGNGGQRQATDLTRLADVPGVQLSVAVKVTDNLNMLCFGWRSDAAGVRRAKVFLMRYIGPRLPHL